MYFWPSTSVSLWPPGGKYYEYSKSHTCMLKRTWNEKKSPVGNKLTHYRKILSFLFSTYTMIHLCPDWFTDWCDVITVLSSLIFIFSTEIFWCFLEKILFVLCRFDKLWLIEKINVHIQGSAEVDLTVEKGPVCKIGSTS